MSMRGNLLIQKEPLELWEINELKDWLAVLQADVNVFGPTPEDVNRMNAIKRKLKEQEK